MMVLLQNMLCYLHWHFHRAFANFTFLQFPTLKAISCCPAQCALDFQSLGNRHCRARKSLNPTASAFILSIQNI